MNNDNLRTHLLHLEQAGHLTDDETTTLLHGLNTLNEAKPNLTAGPSLGVERWAGPSSVAAGGGQGIKYPFRRLFALVRRGSANGSLRLPGGAS